MQFPPTREEISRVAQSTVRAFASSNLECCLFGSAACAQYGASRRPNDVDVIVLAPGVDKEVLKKMLTQKDGRFYLMGAKTPGADYKVLWYRLPSYGRTKRSCKVDILIPGVINIPNIPSRCIELVGTLPVLPVVPLLLLKLQGWVDHSASPRAFDRAKRSVDVADIDQLLAIAGLREDTISSAALEWLPDAFVALARTRVRKYVAEQRGSARHWKALGFETGLEQP